MICKACSAPLRSPLLSISVDGDTFCAPCFVHVRAPLEPSRFYLPTLRALACGVCGLVCVDFDGSGCSQCGSVYTGPALPAGWKLHRETESLPPPAVASPLAGGDLSSPSVSELLALTAIEVPVLKGSR